MKKTVMTIIWVLLLSGLVYAEGLSMEKTAGDITAKITLESNPLVVGKNTLRLELLDETGQHVTDSAGKGLQQDVMRSQVELTRMTDRLLILEQKRQTLTARLNTLLNRPVETPFEGSGETALTALGLTFEDLRKIAEENRPALIGLQSQVDRYRLAHRLGRQGVLSRF